MKTCSTFTLQLSFAYLIGGSVFLPYLVVPTKPKNPDPVAKGILEFEMCDGRPVPLFFLQSSKRIPKMKQRPSQVPPSPPSEHFLKTLFGQ